MQGLGPDPVDLVHAGIEFLVELKQQLGEREPGRLLLDLPNAFGEVVEVGGHALDLPLDLVFQGFLEPFDAPVEQLVGDKILSVPQLAEAFQLLAGRVVVGVRGVEPLGDVGDQLLHPDLLFRGGLLGLHPPLPQGIHELHPAPVQFGVHQHVIEEVRVPADEIVEKIDGLSGEPHLHHAHGLAVHGLEPGRGHGVGALVAVDGALEVALHLVEPGLEIGKIRLLERRVAHALRFLPMEHGLVGVALLQEPEPQQGMRLVTPGIFELGLLDQDFGLGHPAGFDVGQGVPDEVTFGGRELLEPVDPLLAPAAPDELEGPQLARGVDLEHGPGHQPLHVVFCCSSGR